MQSNKLENIKNHLEFLGYEVEVNTNDSGNRMLVSKSKNKPNLISFFGKPEDNFEAIIFRSIWNGLKNIETVDQFRYLNKMNVDGLVKSYANLNDNTLTFETLYTGDYAKKSFGDFIDLFTGEVQRTIAEVEFKKLFLP